MAKTYLEFVSPTQIVSGGGAVTRERYSGDNAQTWKAGQLVKLSSGVVTEVLDNASAATVDTDDIPDGTILFMALEDVDVATSDKVKVQRILSSTILEGPLLTGASTTAPATATESIIGTEYALWQSAAAAASGARAAYPAGWIAVDKNNTTKACATIVDVESNFNPVKDPNADLDALEEQYARVRFKIGGLSDL
jgi:uncharacterized protein YbdZ (MbtH family)